MLNYAGNTCDACNAGNLIIGLQTSVGLSKWCLFDCSNCVCVWVQ